MPTIGELLNSKYNKTFKDQTLSGNNTTVATPLFRITGSVKVTELYAVVTTVLGSNVTAAYWRFNDQTAQVAISLATGTTLSNATTGSTIIRRNVATTALTYLSAAAGAINDPVGGSNMDVFTPFLLVQKTGSVNSDIEFVYTTTNTPTSGVIRHYVEWQPMSEGATLVAV